MIEVSLRATRTTCNAGRPKPWGKIDGHVIGTSACGDGLFSPACCSNARRGKWSHECFTAQIHFATCVASRMS
jgi:hypothetical protein